MTPPRPAQHPLGRKDMPGHMTASRTGELGDGSSADPEATPPGCLASAHIGSGPVGVGTGRR